MTDRGSLVTALVAVVLGALALAAVAGFATGTLPLADDQPDGDALLEDADDRYASAETYTADVTVVVENESASVSTNASVAYKAPNSSRLTVTHNGSESAAGTNGSVAWVDPGSAEPALVWNLSETGERGPAAMPAIAGTSGFGNGSDHLLGNRTAHAKNWTALAGNWTAYAENQTVDDWADAHRQNRSVRTDGNHTDNVTATTLRTETVRGAEAHVVRLEPETVSTNATTTLWIDADDRRIHRVRASEGDNATTIELRDQRFNASVHDSTFRPPDDERATVAAADRYDDFATAQAETAVELRTLDNPDYEFAEATVTTRAGVTVVAQQYDPVESAGETAPVTVLASADDLPSDVTDGESVTVTGANATYVGSDEGGAVYWTDDGANRGVAADLPRERLLELAESVRS